MTTEAHTTQLNTPIHGILQKEEVQKGALKEKLKQQRVIESYLGYEHNGHTQRHCAEIESAFAQWAGIAPSAFCASLTPISIRSNLNCFHTHHTSKPLNNIAIQAMTDKDASGHIYYSLTMTHFGQVILASTQQGVCLLYFCAANRTTVDSDALEIVQHAFPYASLQNTYDIHQKNALEALSALFNLSNKGRCKQNLPNKALVNKEPVKLHLYGTDFQHCVWKQLLTLPYGRLATYSDIAQAIGRPSAVRAVASAIGKNPIAGLIPCHRIVQKTGAMGGYRWGVEKKLSLIGWESLLSI